ncbi:hypothetical protein ATANTOWER_013954 [Ataeniobius toweri]|uniref:Uncharacterized protein n=1 Tax=Ataeniobius toweri TaxID=208326 RepID=A0ABU7A9Q5_9TELE|nr:hypothetical protein [Ataeniobius toweri]
MAGPAASDNMQTSRIICKWMWGDGGWVGWSGVVDGGEESQGQEKGGSWRWEGVNPSRIISQQQEEVEQAQPPAQQRGSFVRADGGLRTTGCHGEYTAVFLQVFRVLDDQCGVHRKTLQRGAQCSLMAADHQQRVVLHRWSSEGHHSELIASPPASSFLLFITRDKIIEAHRAFNG